MKGRNTAIARDALVQVGLLPSLISGNFTACVTAEQLKELGDTGLGTFDSIDGELILLDGTVYQALSDCSIVVPSAEIGVTFASVGRFRETSAGLLLPFGSLAALEGQLTALLPERNYFYTILFEGFFPSVTVRSETPQKTSARPLSEIMETAQRVCSLRELRGTVVGQYCPPYTEGLQVTGWHFHFLSADRKRGGHVLELAGEGGSVRFCEARSLTIHLPQDAVFRGMDLTADHSAAIRRLERGG